MSFNTSRRRSLLAFLIAFFSLVSIPAFSQTDITIGTGTTGNGTTTFPCPLQDYWEGSRAQYLYRASELTAAGMGPGSISSIKFNVVSLGTAGLIEKMTIRIGHTSANTLATTSWDAFSGSTVATAQIDYQPVAGINSFALPGGFFWNGSDNILIEICNGEPNNTSGTFYTQNPVIPWTTGLSFNGSHTRAADNLGNMCGTTETTNTGAQTTRPNLIFVWTAAAACTGAPNAGTATAIPTTVCAGQDFSLQLTGATVASGLTYQWQSSTDNLNWTNITGATNASLTRNQLASTYYRCVVTCSSGGQSASSASVQVLTPALVSGTFTINSAQPTGGTNFQTYNDAYNYISCGINGPVTFNVTPGSGPYVEQLIINPIFGSSSINKVTFNGNGTEIKFTSTNSNERAVIKLNGADHFIFDSLRITASGTTSTDYGFGVQLLNGADSNVVRKSIITVAADQTATNFVGISISASATSAISTGNSECDGNLFEDNLIIGGYYSVTNVGSSTLANQNNRFLRNRLQEFYAYGFYANGTFNTVFEGNDISRPTRTSFGTITAYGIYFTGLSTNAKVNANYIHSMYEAVPTTTNDFYGIYFTGVDALGGLENRVTNNVIYDIKSNGTIYGIYNSSSDNIFYYHNTLSFDHTASASTEVTRGFYQITSAAGIEFKNNIITINRGGTGQQHALYFATTASVIVSNNNNIFLTPSATVNTGYNGTNQATLANWQAAASQDANSVTVNPLYLNYSLGNLTPTAPSLNDLGTPVGVTTDVLGATRSTTSPDMGAYEFSVAGCATPPTPGTAVSSVTAPICPNEPVTLTLQNNSFGTGQTYQWQSSTSSTGPWTNIGTSLTNPNYNLNPTTTLYYRCAVTCSGNTTYSTSIQVLVNSLFPGGTYTINNAQPTAGTNFNSFNDAYAALRCGIAGPVIFNVVTGSGPYNEQLIMGQVQGTSATNTVTFNGNGATISFLSTNTAERAVIKLNGTDHFIFDSLKVVVQGSSSTEYGFGFHLLNSADSNIIRKCDIQLSTATTSSNFAGIVSSIGTTATSTGVNESDYNLIENNTITGGYYGITQVGSTTNAVGNNKLVNNKIRDFYLYGVYLSGNFRTTVKGNQISRPTRTALSTFYGIYATSLNTDLDIDGNHISTPFGGDLANTSSAYGIYFTSVDALGGLENIISNNVIYDMKSEGAIYGIYNSSSDNTLYYHNTISLDHTTASTTSSAYGFYQITLASGLEWKNNLVTISRGGNGSKWAVYWSTTGTSIPSNYNNYFLSGNNVFVGYNGSNRATLANWQAAITDEANSVAVNPFYTDLATGDLKPRAVAMDNRGTPVGVLTDVVGVTRSTSTPDIGAWEYAVPNCVAPPTAGAATATPSSNICITSPIALNLNGASSGAGQTYQWQTSNSATGPWTNLGNPLLFADTTVPASGSIWYRCVVTCSNQSANSTPVQVVLNPPFPPGTYTINNTQATNYPTGTNFNSFVEAVAVMQCGIGGPVTFNVAPGTYTEQVRIPRILGTSATSRVTFQSANGNASSVTLTYGASTTTNNYVLQLDSASFISFKNMTVAATNTTNGRAIELLNAASNDSILNCTVTVPVSTGTTTAIVGIHMSNLSGANNVIKGNTVSGGTTGIWLSGTSTTIPSNYQTLDSNTVSNNYYYGIYTSNASYLNVNKNTVSVASPRNTTTYGIYINNADSLYVVNNNQVTITGATTTTYGMYLTGCATVVAGSSVSNNKIIGTTGNTATLYGIYQTTNQGNIAANNVINVSSTGTTVYGLYSTGGSGGIRYYNNTIRNASAATGTTNAAAYFAHSSSGAGIVDIRNNIFLHDGPGLAMQTTNVSNVYLDYNLYKTTGTSLIRFGTINYATLQDWRNAQNWDYNSLVYTPAFATGNDLRPDPANPEVWAIHGRGEQISANTADHNGNPRPTTLTSGVPDLGAYEFLPTAVPPSLTATPATPAAGTTQVFMFGTDTVQKISWAPGSTVPSSVAVRRYSGIIPPGLATGQASMYYYTDVITTGATPSSFTNQQFYIDPWLRNIPQEATVKMGRTVAAGTWFVSSSSTLDQLGNTITEPTLNFLGKFTGMTDGQAAPNAIPPPSSLDTSNRGKRFWVGYGHHQGFSSNGQDMVLYLSAEDSANVTVRVHGTNWVRNYAIPANTVRVSDLLPENGLVDSRLTDEGLFNRGISIESDVPIVAYAHIYQGSNSGAGMLLPTGVWGYDYTSLNSSQYYSSDTYSWFFVVADRDSTLVEITPSVTTKGGRPAGVPFQVYLNRGQVYNVMGTTSGSAGTDLSGSRIKSIPNASGKCYPIGVFSGSSRTALCYISNGDNFIQQVFPNQAWGTKYLTFGTANSTSNTQYNSNKWRVMVKDPTTVVRVNGTILNQATLAVPGNYYEFGATTGTGASTANYIEADQPVMVAQYMLSTSGDDCPGLAAPTGNGDPEMIYISPIEQGIKRAVFYSTDESGITANYINVIIPTAGLASLRIDGNSTFTDVFAHPRLAGYTCVRHNLGGTAGQHTIVADSAFTAITYGLGSVESYGYNAGTLVKNLSASPSFSNVFNTGNSSSSYTCKGTPFRFSIQLSVRPTKIVWNLSGLSNLSPNANVTQNNPTPTDSVIVNGKKFYIYSLPTQYVFNTTGSFSVPINIFHPSIEGCGGSVEIILPVTVVAAPVVNFTINATGCVGNPFQFFGSSVPSNSNVTTSSWSWNFGVTGATANIQNPTYTYASAGTYNVNLRTVSSDGCVGDTTKPVTVNALPVVNIVEDTVTVCPNASATFTVQNPVSGATYQWYNAATGGTLLGTGTTFTLNNVTGTTSVFLQGIVNGCTSAARDRAVANLLPPVAAPVAQVDSVSTNTIVFKWNAVTNATGYQVSIDNGATWTTPSSGATGLTHTVTNLQLGTTVTLRVRALGGCTPAVSQPVTGQTVTDQVYVPNSFTPNADGLNDVLRVYSNVIRSLRFVVYNQWGEKIAESTQLNNVWDGTHKGKPQPSGVYIYVADIILTNGERIQRKGSVNLVR